jgi:transketolase
MAKEGKKVFIYSIASFVTLRCYEQLKLDLCAMQIPATILAGGVGYSYSFDGPTHHATEDISVLRALGSMNIYSPSDNSIVEKLVDLSVTEKELSYIRFEKGSFQRLYPSRAVPWSQGAAVLREGSDGVIFSTGIMTHRALEVAEILKNEGIQCKVVDIFRIKPFPQEFIVSVAKNAPFCISLEEHAMNGGLGSILSETFTDNSIFISLRRCGIKEELLYAYGDREKLQVDNGLDLDSLCDTIRRCNMERI